MILRFVGWHVAYPLSMRHLEEGIAGRGIPVDHSTGRPLMTVNTVRTTQIRLIQPALWRKQAPLERPDRLIKGAARRGRVGHLAECRLTRLFIGGYLDVGMLATSKLARFRPPWKIAA